MDRPEHDFVYYKAARLGAIMGGMLIGALVNRFVKPPNYTQRVCEEIRLASERVNSFVDHLLASLAARSLLRHSRGVSRLVVVVVILVVCASSFGSQARSVYQLRDSTLGSSRILSSLDLLDHEVVLTDVAHGPQILGPIHYQRKVYLALSPKQLTEFGALLQRNGVSSFSYLSGTSWGRDEQTRAVAEVACSRAADLSFLLTLFDCRVIRQVAS
jgi:hypothetical protein